MLRPAPVRQLLGLALALALLSAASPASAEPTASPALPTASPTPTSTPTATAASPAPPSSPDARRTSGPTAVASPSPVASTKPEVRNAHRPPLPRRVEAMLDRAAQHRSQPLRALEEWDGQPIAVVVASCATPDGATTADAGYIILDATEAESVDWTVTGTAGVVDSGTAPLTEDGGALFSIAGLTSGDFTLTVTEEEVPGRGATTEFTVIGCVTTTVSCKAVTFTNPADNPAVVVLYGRPTEDDSVDEDGAELDLAPDETSTARTALSAISWLGISTDSFDEDGDDFAVSLAGRVDSLVVPNDCDRPLSTLAVSCVDDHPRLGVTFAREGSDQPVRFTVTDRKGKVVARGRPKGSRTVASDRLPGPGRYTYRSYFETAKAYESLPVEIDSCGAAAAPAGDNLADTGPPPLLPLPFGAALLAAGAVLVTRRTRPARPAAPHRRRADRGR